MTFAVCIPWRPAPGREPLFEFVKEFYSDFPVYWADSNEQSVFSRSQAINRAVDLAVADGHDVVVINDADTVPELPSLLKAVELTAEDGRSRLPYDEYYILSPSATSHFKETGEIIGEPYPGACSGCLVIRSDTFEAIGRFDERYRGWGYEDVDFAVRAQFDQVPGKVVGMYHEPAERAEDTANNWITLKTTYGDSI